MLDQGFRLVADDRVLLWTVQGQLFGRAPDVLQGLIEVRGLDVMGETALALCEVRLAIRPGAPERLAEPEFTQYLGVRLPSLALRYLDASAPAKLRRAIGALYLANQRRM
jgi:serine kinase of HPr protein (carbohydrate metabolism regulator)